MPCGTPGPSRVTVQLRVDDAELTLTMENPVASAAGPGGADAPAAGAGCAGSPSGSGCWAGRHRRGPRTASGG